MPTDIPSHGLQLRSLVKSDGTLELSLASVPTPEPGADEVVVRVEAAPVNPSDLALLFGPADMSAAKVSGTPESPVITARIPERFLKFLALRVDQSMPVGNEGAGVVVRAGSSPQAQALLGKMVAASGGAMYSQYRALPVSTLIPLPDGTTAEEGASAFVNPLTALGMLDTMRREGHKALVHTAAASNLGQMLVRLCQEDKVPLVNIVRKKEQVDLLRGMGAVHVCDSTSPTFLEELTEAIATTGATLGFDAIGGGKLASQILSCMEMAISRNAKSYSRYGSSTHKQVYIYGALDVGPTELTRSFGLSWGLGGWLVSNHLAQVGPAGGQALRDRVVRDLKTTFASKYAGRCTLAEALQPAAMAAYGRRATGEKYLITPNVTRRG